MAIESAQRVRLVAAGEEQRTSLINEMAQGMGPMELERIRQSMDTNARTYLIEDSDTATAEGCVLLQDYDRLERAVEMVPWLDRLYGGTDQYREVFRETVNTVSLDDAVDFIVLKVEDNKPEQIQAAESLGFLKEGIYISNQYLKGEFSFYSVYMYKLS